MITLLVEPAEFGGSELELTAAAFHHLFRVRRAKVGDPIRAVDGQGRARWSTVDRIGRGEATLTLGESAPNNEPVLDLTLWVAFPKPERAVWLVEKATEVGVSAIGFLTTDRSPRSPGPATLSRLHRIAVAAVEQSHRSRVPRITGPHPWESLGELLLQTGPAWFLQPGAGAGLSLPGNVGTAAMLVGPEGGWTETERETLERLGCAPLGLGPTVLRIETASVVGAALLLCQRHPSSTKTVTSKSKSFK